MICVSFWGPTYFASYCVCFFFLFQGFVHWTGLQYSSLYLHFLPGKCLDCPPHGGPARWADGWLAWEHSMLHQQWLTQPWPSPSGSTPEGRVHSSDGGAGSSAALGAVLCWAKQSWVFFFHTLVFKQRKRNSRINCSARLSGTGLQRWF